MTPTSDQAAPAAPRFAYFVLQTRTVVEAGAVTLTGVLEDLGSGEKRAFSGEEGLAHLVAEWTAQDGAPT